MSQKRILRYEFLPMVGFCILFLSIATGLTFFKLNTIPGPLSASEKSYIEQTVSAKKIYDDPVNAPHKTLAYIAGKATRTNSAVASRAASAIFGILAITTFYYILKHWHTRRMALLGTLIFATSSYFLHVSRFAGPISSQLFILPLIAYGIWAVNSKRYQRSLVFGVLLIGLSLYVPGLPWLVAASIIWQRKRVGVWINKSSWITRLLALSILACLILPIAMNFLDDGLIAVQLLGLPTAVPAMMTILNNLLNIPKNLFIIGPNDPQLWLGKLPIINVLVSTMAALGAYSFYFRLRLDRSRLLLVCIGLLTILIALGGPVTLASLTPFIFILATSGLTLMAQQWFTIFPRNPLAQTIGITLIGSVVTMSVYYELNHYFVAWPNSPETKQIFVQNL